jgi:hypothetical protein
MALIERFPGEKPVVPESMLGHLPFYPRHLVDHQTLLGISKEAVGSQSGTGYKNIHSLEAYYPFYIYLASQ